MYSSNRPSAFNPDLLSKTPADAPGCVSIIAAKVLGALIAEQVLKFDFQPGETIELVDSIIASAIDSALSEIDLPELQKAIHARRRAEQEG